MTDLTRRQAIATTGATLLSSTLAAPAIAASRERIDRRIARSLNFIDNNMPQYAPLFDSSAAVILIPRIIAGGVMFGGAYGEGALLVQRNVVEYYNMAMANIGFQFGIQQYGSALFFRDPETVAWFQKRDGWTLGVDLQYTAVSEGENADLDTTTAAKDVYGLIYGKKGVMFGLTLDGAKYSRINR